MFYGSTPQDTRQLFFSSWKKHKQNQPLSALEQQIAHVILDHPEYHALLEQVIQQEQSYFPELGQTNPFLHMGLHLAIRDQISTNKPEGIAIIYQQLLNKYSNQLEVEHLLIEPLAESLWQAQRNQSMIDEDTYLNACRALITT